MSENIKNCPNINVEEFDISLNRITSKAGFDSNESLTYRVILENIPVLVKLFPFFTGDDYSVCLSENLLSKINFLFQLNYPNIARLRGYSRFHNFLCLIFEDIKGILPLHKVLAKNPELPWRIRIDWAHQMASTLYMLMSLKIPIYQDINMNNILVDIESNRVVFIGFGISFLNSSSLSEISTPSISIYTAPELLFSNNSFHNEELILSELYSLSLVFYNLATSIPPFFDQKNNNLKKNDIFRLVKQGYRPEISLIHLNCPSEFKNLIFHCWNQFPRERPSWNDVIDYLNKIHISLKEKPDFSPSTILKDNINEYESKKSEPNIVNDNMSSDYECKQTSCLSLDFTINNLYSISYIPGISVPQVDNNNDMPNHTWSIYPGEVFHLRQTGYLTTQQKGPSEQNIYDVFAFDVFSMPNKIDNIARIAKLPTVPQEDQVPGFPNILVVNVQIPNYSPSIGIFSDESDGDGYSFVFYMKMKPWVIEILKGNVTPLPTSLLLLKRFFTLDPNDSLVHRLKGICRMDDIEKMDFNFFLESLITKFNMKPFLFRPQIHFYHTKEYFECDIDVHRFKYLARQVWWNLKDYSENIKFQLAFTVEGHNDQELPEQAIGSLCINHLNLDSCVPFVFSLTPSSPPSATGDIID